MFWFNFTHTGIHINLIGIYIVGKSGTDWSIFAGARVYTKSNMANFLIQGQITQRSDPITSIIILIWDLKVHNILTKFGADWLIFVDVRVLTRKLWTDGWMDIVWKNGRRTPTDGEWSQQLTEHSVLRWAKNFEKVKCLLTPFSVFYTEFSKAVFQGKGQSTCYLHFLLYP